MTEKEFVTWFKGFVAAANTFNITPNQWDTICDQLDRVKQSDILNMKTETTNTTAQLNNINYTTKTLLND